MNIRRVLAVAAIPSRPDFAAAATKLGVTEAQF